MVFEINVLKHDVELGSSLDYKELGGICHGAERQQYNGNNTIGFLKNNVKSQHILKSMISYQR